MRAVEFSIGALCALYGVVCVVLSVMAALDGAYLPAVFIFIMGGVGFVMAGIAFDIAADAR